MVTNELRGEKVDIVPYADDPAEFVARALQPARVKEVRLDEETGTATVVVHDFQLSLAIGKEGQNARLAARLTGWRIDIKSETQLAEEESGVSPVDWAEGEWLRNASGEMVFQPAGGGVPVSMAEWAQGGGPEGLEAPAPEAPEGDAGAEPVTATPGAPADGSVEPDAAVAETTADAAVAETAADAAVAETAAEVADSADVAPDEAP
jgi:N utilization substance protein A